MLVISVQICKYQTRSSKLQFSWFTKLQLHTQQKSRIIILWRIFVMKTHHTLFNPMYIFSSFMLLHYNDVIMTTIAPQITSLTVVYSTVYWDANQRKHQSSASLAFVRGIHRGPVNSPHKGPVTRKMFPFDDVIMCFVSQIVTHMSQKYDTHTDLCISRFYTWYVFLPLFIHFYRICFPLKSLTLYCHLRYQNDSVKIQRDLRDLSWLIMCGRASLQLFFKIFMLGKHTNILWH